MVFMEYGSGRILHMEVGDSIETGGKSAVMEGMLLERGILQMEKYGLVIKEVVTDASSTFINFFAGKIYIPIMHLKNIFSIQNKFYKYYFIILLLVTILVYLLMFQRKDQR